MLTINRKKCTGCHACELVCPKKCISFEKDEYGFIYPYIDREKCSYCGACEKICHAEIQDKNEFLKKEKKQFGYYGWSKDESLIYNSSSGGAFSSIVESWLDDEGVVFGATYTEDLSYVCHQSFKKSNYAPLRKSKYVFSDPEHSYAEVKECLNKGEKVLFTGTPCQIAGLKAFLCKDYENLLTMDFICHGTPSIDMLNEHVKYVSKGKKVIAIDFRSKKYGWRKYCLKINNSDGEYIKSIEEDFYLYAFMKYRILRECCYFCQYSDGHHVSDITLADFWGIKSYKPDYTANKGVSLIIFNNEEALSATYTGLKTRMELCSLEKKEYAYIYKSHDKYDYQARKETLVDIKSRGMQTLSQEYYNRRHMRTVQKVFRKLFRK